MSENNSTPRKFIGVHFQCCGVYARIYHNPKHNAYMGSCPKCLKRVKVEVDKARATTNSRFFKAR